MLFGHSMDIWVYIRGDNITDWEIDFYVAISDIFLHQLNYLFLWLAIMLNIAKWVYFILVIKTHRGIREYEIYVKIMYEEKVSE